MQQQAVQAVDQIKSQASVAVNQAEQQVELMKRESERFGAEAAREKELETEQTFAERIRQTELQMQQLEESFQTRVNSMHEQVKEDYALELRTAKMNMVERTEQQQKHIESQERELQAMKDQVEELKSAKLQQRDQVHQVITGLEERSEAAERRSLDLEIKMMQLTKENLKRKLQIMILLMIQMTVAMVRSIPIFSRKVHTTATTRKVARRNPPSVPLSRSPLLQYH